MDLRDSCLAGLPVPEWPLFLGGVFLSWFPCIILAQLLLVIPARTLEFAMVDPRFSHVLHSPTTSFIWSAFLPLILSLVRGEDERCTGDDELLTVILMLIVFTALLLLKHILLRSISYTYYSQSLSRMQNMLEADTIMSSLVSYLRKGRINRERYLGSSRQAPANMLRRLVQIGNRTKAKVESRGGGVTSRGNGNEIEMTEEMKNNEPSTTTTTTTTSNQRPPINPFTASSSSTRSDLSFDDDAPNNNDPKTLSDSDNIHNRKEAFTSARNFIIQLRSRANRFVDGRAVRFSSNSISSVAEEIGSEIFDGLVKRRPQVALKTATIINMMRPIKREEQKEDAPVGRTLTSASDMMDDDPTAERLSWDDFRRPFLQGSTGGSPEEADQFAASCLSLFDDIGDPSTTVTKAQLVSVIAGILAERNALVVNSFDSQHALRHLDSLLLIFVLFISSLVWLLMWDVDLNKLFITFSTFVLAFAFFFGATAREFFQGVIFVFVRHPYDVGDKVIIEGEKFTVEEIQLLSTVMKHISGSVDYMPHNLLNNKRISNVYRSGSMLHEVDFYVSSTTPEEKLVELEKSMSEFFHSTMKRQLSVEDWSLSLLHIDELRRLHCRIWVRQRTNFQNAARGFRNRTRIIRALRKALMDLDISYEFWEGLGAAASAASSSASKLDGIRKRK